MAPQDDERERQMVSLFNLTVPADRGRADIDAYLDLRAGADPLPFELKSTTYKSISTVRDFGPEHIAKWRRLHWLFAFFERDGRTLRHCYYASPADMAPWIEEKARYIRPDLVLAESAPQLITDATLSLVIGEDVESCSMDQAKLIMKKQWSAAQYLASADLPDHRFSRSKMVELLQARCEYVIRRGATLNNPHIPESYFATQGLHHIEHDHAATLRTQVARYLAGGEELAELDPVVAHQARAASTDDATA